MDTNVPMDQSPRVDDQPSSSRPVPVRGREGFRFNTNLRRLSMKWRGDELPGLQKHAVETARVAAMLRSAPADSLQPELYTVPEGEESDDEIAAAHAAPRTIQASKELLDRVERMRKFHSHDYEPPVCPIVVDTCQKTTDGHIAPQCDFVPPICVPAARWLQQRYHAFVRTVEAAAMATEDVQSQVTLPSRSI
jgi:hypothetical protein